MANPPKKPKPEDMKNEPDQTKDPEFQKVVQAFLKTPPRQHKDDVGKGAKPKRPKKKSR